MKRAFLSLFLLSFSSIALADDTCDNCFSEKEARIGVELNGSVNDVLKVASNVNVLDEGIVAELCRTMRTQQDSIKRPRFGYAENNLLELAGIDPDNTTSTEIRQKMEEFFKANYKKLECTDVVSPFPKGNYLKQLASGNYLRQFQTFLRAYKFPTNIIDESDGCTVLDYVDTQIRITPAGSSHTHEYLQNVRKLLIREGAKHANDLGGKC